MSKTEEQNYAEACADHFLNVAKQWKNEEKLIILGTDSARNMVTAARLLPFEHQPYTAHIFIKQNENSKQHKKVGEEIKTCH